MWFPSPVPPDTAMTRAPTAEAPARIDGRAQTVDGSGSQDHEPDADPGRRRRRRVRLVAILLALLALAIQVDVARSMFKADDIRDDASTVRAERDVLAADVANERATLTRATEEAQVAANALADALANLAPGASPESNDADLDAARVELATTQDAAAQLTATSAWNSLERARLVGCLAYAEQALGYAQTRPPNSSSMFAFATVACRDAGTGAFTNVGGP